MCIMLFLSNFKTQNVLWIDDLNRKCNIKKEWTVASVIYIQYDRQTFKKWAYSYLKGRQHTAVVIAYHHEKRGYLISLLFEANSINSLSLEMRIWLSLPHRPDVLVCIEIDSSVPSLCSHTRLLRPPTVFLISTPISIYYGKKK